MKIDQSEEIGLGLKKLKDAFRAINKWEVEQIDVRIKDRTFEASPGFEENTLKECLAILRRKKKC